MATDESMDDDDDDNNDASTDDPCERRSLHGRVEGSPSRGRSSSPHSTRPLDLEHRKAGTPRAAVKVLARGGAAAQRSPETVPRREVRPRNRRPLGKSCLQRRGTGPNPRGTETGPTKAPDTAWLPTATAARKSVLDANHEPLRLTHIRNHAHGPGEQPPSETHAAGRLSEQPHEAQDRVGEGALTATRYATGRTGRRRRVQPSCGKGCRRNGTPCGTGPSHVRNSSGRGPKPGW